MQEEKRKKFIEFLLVEEKKRKLGATSNKEKTQSFFSPKYVSYSRKNDIGNGEAKIMPMVMEQLQVT